MDASLQFFLEFKGQVVVAWFCLIFVIERFLAVPARSSEGATETKWRLLYNFTFFAINALIGPLLVLYMHFASQGSFFNWRGVLWTGPLTVLVDLVILDGIIYWWHRFNHEVTFLWRFHEVHHLDESLDSTTALRFHIGEVVLSALFRSIFVVLLDIPLGTVLLAEGLILIAAIFHHGNFSLPKKVEKWSSKIIITPGLHWTHHQAKRKDTDSNYGNILAFWDIFFRSRNINAKRDVRIGVEGKREGTLKDLLLDPFSKKK